MLVLFATGFSALPLPVELREQDQIAVGQQFEIERIRAGEYHFRTIAESVKPALVKWLLSKYFKQHLAKLSR